MPMDKFAGRLHNKACTTSRSAPFHADKLIEKAPPYPQDDPSPDNPDLDGTTVDEYLGGLTDASMAEALSHLSSDPHNYKAYVNEVCSLTPCEMLSLTLFNRRM